MIEADAATPALAVRSEHDQRNVTDFSSFPPCRAALAARGGVVMLGAHRLAHGPGGEAGWPGAARSRPPGLWRAKVIWRALKYGPRPVRDPPPLRNCDSLADTGLAVDLTVRVPDGPVRPRPTVLLLGGRGTGRDAARLGHDIGDVVVAALSYPFAGDPTVTDLQAVLQLPRIQRAVLDTVPAILLATDYLLEQPYIDANRLELVGVSLGAFLVSPAGVLDKRIRRVWIVHGAGKPVEVIDYGLRDKVHIRPLRRMIAALVNVLAAGHYLAPERWVGRISPRPVIAINARDDGRLPRASVEALHAALKDPYEIVWLDGPHVQPNRPEVIERLSAQILKRVSYEALGDH